MIDPIRGRLSFENLRRRGATLRSGPLWIRFMADNSSNPKRQLSFSLSAKLAGAVKRNRFRRRTKEVFRLHEKALPAGSYLILSDKKTVNMPFSEIEEAVLKIADKIATAKGAATAKGTTKSTTGPKTRKNEHKN